MRATGAGARTVCALLWIAVAVSSEPLPTTAKSALKGWQLLPAKQYNPGGRYAVDVILPSGEESAAVCILGPVRRLGPAPGPITIPACWAWAISIPNRQFGDADMAEVAAEIKKHSIPGLDLGYQMRVTDKGITQLNGLRELRYLNLARTSVTDAGLGRLDMPNLVAINLEGCRNITDVGVGRLAAMPNLVALNLDGCMNLTAKGLSRLKQTKRLVWLGLAQTRANDDTIESLSPLKKLEVLHLSGTQVTGKSAKRLNGFKKLRAVSLASCQIGDRSVGYLARNKELEALDLSLTQVGKGAGHFFEKYKRIKWLSLDGLKIGDRALRYLGRCPTLEHLDLTDTQVSAGGVARLVGLPLKSISFKSAAVDDAVLETVARVVTLERLYFHHCPKITDKGVNALKTLRGLKTLGLRNASQVTDKGMTTIGAFAKLEWADLYGLTQITDTGVKELEGLKSLQQVNLGGCRMVTNQGVASLKQALPRVRIQDPSKVMRPDGPAIPRPR